MTSGFVRVSLAATILRFETAGVAGLAVVRAMLQARSGRLTRNLEETVATDPACLFCRIVRGDPASVVYETPEIVRLS